MDLSNVAPKHCARSFVQSVRFAGLVSADEIIRSNTPVESPSLPKNQDAGGQTQRELTASLGAEEQKFILPLDRTGTRKFIAISPATITSQELKESRIGFRSN